MLLITRTNYISIIYKIFLTFLNWTHSDPHTPPSTPSTQTQENMLSSYNIELQRYVTNNSNINYIPIIHKLFLAFFN